MVIVLKYIFINRNNVDRILSYPLIDRLFGTFKELLNKKASDYSEALYLLKEII